MIDIDSTICYTFNMNSQDLYNELWTKIHDLVDSELASCDTETEEYIRNKLTESFRFWKREE